MQIGGMYTIDFARVSKIPKFEVTIKNGDSKRTIKLILLKNSEVLNLNDYTVVVAAKKIDGKDIFNDVKTIDAESGICEVEITEQMLALDIDLPCEIVLYGKDGTVASSSNFVINKMNSIRNDEDIVSTSEFKALTTALSDVSYVKSNLYNKRDKSIKIKSFDLDTSSNESKIKEVNLSEEVKQMMAGNTPIYSEVSNGGVTTEKYANGSITGQKLKVQQGYIMDDNYFLNVDIYNKKITISDNTMIIQSDGKYYTVQTPQNIELSSTGYFSVFVSKSTGSLIIHYVSGYPENNDLVYLFSYWNAQANLIAPYQKIKLNGKKVTQVDPFTLDEDIFSIASQQKLVQSGLFLDYKINDADGEDNLVFKIPTNGNAFSTQIGTDYVGAWIDEIEFSDEFNKIEFDFITTKTNDVRKIPSFIKLIVYDGKTKEILKEFSKTVSNSNETIIFFSSNKIKSNSGTLGILAAAYNSLGEIVPLSCYNVDTSVDINRKGFYLSSNAKNKLIFATISPKAILTRLDTNTGFTTGVRLYNTTKKHTFDIKLNNNIIDKDFISLTTKEIISPYDEADVISRIDAITSFQKYYIPSNPLTSNELGPDNLISMQADYGNGLQDGTYGFNKMGNRYKACDITFDTIKAPITYFTNGFYEPKYVVFAIKQGISSYEKFTFTINKNDNGKLLYFPLGKKFDFSSGGDIYMYMLNESKDRYVLLRNCNILKSNFTQQGLDTFETLIYSSALPDATLSDNITVSPANYGYAFTLLTTEGYKIDKIISHEFATIDKNKPNEIKISLPNVIYMNTNEVFSIYYNNIIKGSQLYRKGAYYIRGQVKNGDKYETIKQTNSTDYKWEYTTSSPGEFVIEFRIYETYSQKIVDSKEVKFIVKNPINCINKNPKIVTLGDSFTDGYRVSKFLYTFLEQRGLTPISYGINSADYKEYKDDAWSGYGYNWYHDTEFGYLRSDRPLNDTDNEWNPGWGYNEPNGWTDGDTFITLSEDQRKNGKTRNQFFNPATRRFDFSYYMNKYHSNAKIDYVVSFAGLNDVIWNPTQIFSSTIQKLLSKVKNIISSIHEYDPTIKIILGTVTPQPEGDTFTSAQYGDDFKHYERCKYNQELWNDLLISELSTDDMISKNVYIIPTSAHFDSRYSLKSKVIKPCKFDETYEEIIEIDIHPNEIGAKYMADTATNYVIGLS